MSEPILRSERRGAVALLTLDRPKALNALDRALLEALGEEIERVADASEIGALVLTGEGRAFAAGADIEQMRGMSPVEALAFSRLGHGVLAALEELPIPTIAAVNGFALGGGCELALACDWIYASTAARFGQPEVSLGLLPGFGGTTRLVRRVGIAWARELVLTGAPISAPEALRLGLANRVFEPDELLEAALGAGEAIGRNGPLAVAAAKRVMQQGQDADIRTAHALEQQAVGLSFATEDRSEGIAAFLEKRDPKFERR
ncbi:MAG: enoyl-CoA hydratase-related protein [Myxococcota bacterium]|nr:enoyl-CoA hydratase-related protein [Myxococcota bacterium]